MTKTENYQLPQWEASDPIKRGDFNDAMSVIDAGLAAAQAAAGAAQETADTARTEAAALPYVVGSYTGTNETQTITLGFRPRYVIVSGQRETTVTNSTSDYDRYFGMSAGNIMTHRLAFTDTGFTVYAATTYSYPHFNAAERVYDYIAFK